MVDRSKPLAGRTTLMSGGSRSIGLAIAVRAAREGVNVAFIAKTDTADPRIPCTVHTAAPENEAIGAQALPIVGDIRNETSSNQRSHRRSTALAGSLWWSTTQMRSTP
jgi:citronellol/citronellal dehydrogenase